MMSAVQQEQAARNEIRKLVKNGIQLNVSYIMNQSGIRDVAEIDRLIAEETTAKIVAAAVAQATIETPQIQPEVGKVEAESAEEIQQLTIETVQQFWSPEKTQESIVDEVIENFPDEDLEYAVNLVDQVIQENAPVPEEIPEAIPGD